MAGNVLLIDLIRGTLLLYVSAFMDEVSTPVINQEMGSSLMDDRPWDVSLSL